MNYLLYQMRRHWKASRPAPTIKPQAFALGVLSSTTKKHPKKLFSYFVGMLIGCAILAFIYTYR